MFLPCIAFPHPELRLVLWPDCLPAPARLQHFALLGVFNSKVVQSHDHASAQQKAHAVMQQISGPDTPPSVLTKAASIRVVHELTKLGSLRELTRSASSHSNQSGLHRRAAAESAAPSLAWDHETQMLGLKVGLTAAPSGAELVWMHAWMQQVHPSWMSECCCVTYDACAGSPQVRRSGAPCQ